MWKKYTGIIIISIVSSKLSAVTNTNGYFETQLNQFHSSIGNVPGNKSFAELFFDTHKKLGDKKVGFENRFTVAGRVNDQSLIMYSLQEAYLGYHFNLQTSLKVGRIILPWSEVDSVWGFGKVNNRRNFNFFDPQHEGLIGVHLEHKSGSGIRYRAFVSGLYVPETNPKLDINNSKKTISSRHPWADVPASKADVQGTIMPIRYDVDYPSVTDVIYRYSVGANIGYESEHWSMDNFIIRKPENQISADVEVNVDFISQVVNASVTPSFYYHDVYGSTLVYKNLKTRMYLSGMAIRPNTYPDVNEEATRYTEIKSKKRREDYVGGGISQVSTNYAYGLNYVARLSPYDRLSDELSVDPRWNQTINLFGKRKMNDKWSISGDVKFDMLTFDRLLMMRVDYSVTKTFRLLAGVQMIGTPDDGKSYWSAYTNNDSIYGGLRYAYE